MVLPSSTEFFCGVGAAVVAPFLMVLGFMIWDDHWTKKKGSAFSLNMFKCNLTALWFLLVVIAINITKEGSQSSLSSSTTMSLFAASLKNTCTKLNPFRNEDIKFLFASSTVGILIGDWTWIEGLKYLGARKVIVMDSLKPFLAALVGLLLFDEKFQNPSIALIGLILSVSGVVLVGIEVEGDKHQEEQECSRILDNDRSNEVNAHGEKVDGSSTYYGVLMALMNVVLHTLGATLTKTFGADMNTWEINFVRFGFSGICMLVLTVLLQMRDRVSRSCLESSRPLQFQSTDSTTSLSTAKQHYGSLPTIILAPTTPSCSHDSKEQETRWYILPNLSRASWIRVTIGVVFVSFMHPALTNYAMFQIPLALLLTLESIGPLYSLPLAVAMYKECPSIRASVGAVLAVTGISLLSLQGKAD